MPKVSGLEELNDVIAGLRCFMNELAIRHIRSTPRRHISSDSPALTFCGTTDSE